MKKHVGISSAVLSLGSLLYVQLSVAKENQAETSTAMVQEVHVDAEQLSKGAQEIDKKESATAEEKSGVAVVDDQKVQADAAQPSKGVQKADKKKSTPKADKKKQAQKNNAKNSAKPKEKQITDECQQCFLIDGIQAVIFSEEGTDIITKSDIERHGLEGAKRTLDDLVLERLMYLDAKKYKMLSSESDIDKHLAALQRENNITLDDIKTIFKSAGYTYEEGREQLGVMSAVSSIIDFKIRSRLIVPEKEVAAYYNEHPEKLEPAYQLRRALIPFSSAKTKEALQQEIEQFIKTGTGLLKIEWSDTFWINQSDIAESKKFIVTLKPGQVWDAGQTPEGFELFTLVAKQEERLRSLEERYREIADLLRRPRYEALMADYKKNLFKTASIAYLK